MALRITNPQKDIATLNAALAELADLRTTVQTLRERIKQNERRINALAQKADPVSANSVTFAWDGTVPKITWTAGTVEDRDGNNLPVPAGTITTDETGVAVQASHTYWLAWNPAHQRMAIHSNAKALNSNPLNLVLCSILTGSLIQTGNAGGGGTDPGGYGFNRKEYVFF